MELIQRVFKMAEEGDRILISFPDMLSFYSVAKWLIESFGEPLWVLWTDAAVERINYLGRKFGFPTFGKAITFGARKACHFLDVVSSYDLHDSIKIANKNYGSVLIISFGVNFLELFGYSISKAVEFTIEHEDGILCTCCIGEAPKELIPFQDTFIEIRPAENSYLTYRNYVAKLRFTVEGGGDVEVSDSFILKEDLPSSYHD